MLGYTMACGPLYADLLRSYIIYLKPYLPVLRYPTIYPLPKTRIKKVETKMLHRIVDCFKTWFIQFGTVVANSILVVCNNPQHRYRHMKVIRPALFEADSAKQRWTLCKKGELDLGQGE